MSKEIKIIVILMIMIIASYICFSIYNKYIKLNQESELSTSGDKFEEYIEEYKSNVEYSLESGENYISLIAKGTEETSTTKYIYNDGKMTEIFVLEEIESGDKVDGVYNEIKNSETFSQIYSSIEVEGNRIILKLKDQYPESFSNISMEELYDTIKKSIESKNQTEIETN